MGDGLRYPIPWLLDVFMVVEQLCQHYFDVKWVQADSYAALQHAIQTSSDVEQAWQSCLTAVGALADASDPTALQKGHMTAIMWNGLLVGAATVVCHEGLFESKAVQELGLVAVKHVRVFCSLLNVIIIHINSIGSKYST